MPHRRESIVDEPSRPGGYLRDLMSRNANVSAETSLISSQKAGLHTTGFGSRRMVKRQTSTNATNINQANSKGGLQSFNGPQSGCFGCFFLQDNNPTIHYVGVWTLSGGKFGTTHSTVVPGASLWLKFNGTGIGLFGTVPMSNETFLPPTAIFTIDHEEPLQTMLPRATVDIPNQPIFASSHPLSKNEHILIINVTAASTPFTVARFSVFPSFVPSMDMMIGQPIASSVTTSTFSSRMASATIQNLGSSASSRSNAGSHRALAAGLGTFFVLLVGAAIAAFIVWRRRRRQAIKPFCPAAANARPDTVYTSFTSTESILRYNSGLWSAPSFISPRSQSQYSRSDGRRSNLETLPPPLPPKHVVFDASGKPG